jgi:hypothetical protein
MSTDQKQQAAQASAAAATDVSEFISDLDGGMFERMLSIALSQTAAAAVDHSKPGEVTIKLKIEQIPGTAQVRMQHDLKFVKPTMTGKSSEETGGATVLYVGRYGALSLAQPSLLDKERQQRFTD